MKNPSKAYRAHARRVRNQLRRIARKASPGPPVKIARRRVSRDQVAQKTAGNCHMCGDSLNGRWQVGHVQPYRRGGQCSVKNCLPICAECNRLRWSYTLRLLRFMLLFGRYAKQEIRGEDGTPTELGERLIQLHIRNSWSNDRRRRVART
jgi:hypothetical protein